MPEPKFSCFFDRVICVVRVNYPKVSKVSDTIIRILKGEASREECDLFFKQADRDAELAEEYVRLKNIWSVSATNLQMVSLSQRKVLFESFWNKTNKKTNSTNPTIWVQLAQYAAILVVALVVGYLLVPHKNVPSVFREFSAAPGSVATLSLQDGSKIWLNSRSSIRIDESDPQNIRAMLSGEGYFEIIHNEKRNFVVDLGKIQVRDLGTRFNIKAYPDDKEIVTTLEEGAIDISINGGAQKFQLGPQEFMAYNQNTNLYRKGKIDPELSIGWKDGKFVFLNLTLGEICRELEKWYDVKIILKARVHEDEKYTSVIKRSTTILHVLEMLKMTTKIEYRIENKTDGPDLIYLY